MEFSLKKYQNIKIVNILKKNNFLLFSINANQNSSSWLTLEQHLSRLNIAYHKTYNNVAKKIFKKSILKNFKNLISSTFFFLKQKKINKKTVLKINIISALRILKFTTITFKLNKKLHTTSQLKKITSLNYKKNTIVAYQFLVTALKIPANTNPKQSGQCDSNT